MKKFLIIIFCNLLLTVVSFGQKMELFQDVISKFDNIETVDDWKENTLGQDYSIERKKKREKNTQMNEWSHLQYDIKYKGIPVEHSMIKVHKKNGKIISINGEYFPNLDLDVRPQISESIAFEAALQLVGSEKYIWETENISDDDIQLKHLLNRPVGELIIKQNKQNKRVSLCYKYQIVSVSPNFKETLVYINAKDGSLVSKISLSEYYIGPADTRYSGTKDISTSLLSGQYRLFDSTRGNGIETLNLTNHTENEYAMATNFLDDDNNWSSNEYDNSTFDNAALDAHWGAMMTYDYFNTIHNRNSYDGNGARVRLYVHLLTNVAYQNHTSTDAFWSPSLYRIFLGDGSSNFGSTNYTDAMVSLDIIAHEFGHGVNQYTADLVYQNESGAISESLSDIWSACVENFVGNSYSDKWTLGEDVDNAPITQYHTVDGHGHMDNPNLGGIGGFIYEGHDKGEQADTYNGDFWFPVANCVPISGIGTGNDNCYVHYNKGVFNYWFFLLTNGGNGTNDFGTNYSVNGIDFSKSEKIIYKSLTDYFTPNTNYIAASALTINAAQELFGWCSSEVVSVINAWKAVGINVNLNVSTSLYLTDDIYSDGLYSATNNILAVNTIHSPAKVTYRAGSYIRFLHGFRVKSGAQFFAYVEPCAPNFPSSNRLAHSDSSNNKEIKNNFDKDYVILYPNPVHNILNIKNAKSSHLKIYNAMGVLLEDKYIEDEHIRIDFSKHSSGVYFIHLFEKKINKIYKIIKN